MNEVKQKLELLTLPFPSVMEVEFMVLESINLDMLQLIQYKHFQKTSMLPRGIKM